MTNGPTVADFGSAALRYFEPYVRAVEYACSREGRTANVITPDGRVGLFGLTREEHQGVADRYGFGRVSAERLLGSRPLQTQLASSLLSEYYRRGIRAAWGREPDERIPSAVEDATRAFLADRAAAAVVVERAYARDDDAFVGAVFAGMGLERIRSGRPTRALGDEGRTLALG